MGGGALLKGLWRGGKLQRTLAAHGYNYVSCRAMSSRLFVGGLSFTTEEEGLRTAFSKFGEVVDARIVTDRESGRSRGFGFVTFLAEADADTAKDKLNGQFLDGRVIRVDRASPRPAPPLPPPRLSMPEPSSEEQTTSQDWGSIPSPIAAVPQNAGLVQATGAGGAVPSSDLPSLSSLASSQANTPPSYSVPSPSPPPPPEPPRPSFSFNLDLSKPDPNFVPRHRPPRLRPSMMDYEFGLFSDTSKFPYNTNFGTGFLKVRGPEAEFDFSDIKEAAAKKKAEEAAAKQAQEAEAAAKEIEDAAAKQAQEAEVAAKEAENSRDKQAQEVEGVVEHQPDEVAAATMVSGPEAKEAEGVSAKHAEEAATQSAAAATLESRDAPQNTLQADATAQVDSGLQTASQEPSRAALSDSSPLSTAEASSSELRQVGL